MKNKVLIVISDYYEEIGKNLLKGALTELKLNKITYDIFCFKLNKGATYIPFKAGLLWTVNGQTHAISGKNIFLSEITL